MAVGIEALWHGVKLDPDARGRGLTARTMSATGAGMLAVCALSLGGSSDPFTVNPSVKPKASVCRPRLSRVS